MTREAAGARAAFIKLFTLLWNQSLSAPPPSPSRNIALLLAVFSSYCHGPLRPDGIMLHISSSDDDVADADADADADAAARIRSDQNDCDAVNLPAEVAVAIAHRCTDSGRSHALF